MDPNLDLEARRLFVSTALTTHALRSLGGRIAPGAGARDLGEMARRIAEEAELVESRYSLSFEPSYPGITGGPEATRGEGVRLVLACEVLHDTRPLGVAFTILIPGRLPQVSVAPSEARIPSGWRSPAELP